MNKKGTYVSRGNINAHTTPTLSWIGVIPPIEERELPIRKLFTRTSQCIGNCKLLWHRTVELLGVGRL